MFRRFFLTRQYSLWLILLYSLIALALIGPISGNGYLPLLKDFINHLGTIIQAKMALEEGQFPLRVLPLETYHFRYPLLQFYSPSVYTVTAIIYKWLTPSNPLLAMKIMLVGSLALGAFYMNRLALWLLQSKPSALLASIVYLLSPYYIIVLNGFGDFCEAVGLGLLPAALYYSFQSFNHPNLCKNIIQLGGIWYLLITTHLITAFYGFILFYFLLVMICIKNPHHWRNLLYFSIAAVFAGILAAWFLGPIHLFGKYLNVLTTFNANNTLNRNHPSFAQLIYPGANSFQKETTTNYPAIGWFLLSGFVISLYAFIQKQRIACKRANYWLPFLLFQFAFVFFIVWSPINLHLPTALQMGQYSWRFLGQLLWVGALLFGWSLSYLFGNAIKNTHVILTVLLIGVSAHTWFPSLPPADLPLKEYLEKPLLVFNPYSYGLNTRDYPKFIDYLHTLPIYNLMDNNTLRLNVPYIFPRALLNFAYKPFIAMDGTIPEKFPANYQLMAFINGKMIASKTLTPGNFNWKIPIDQLNKPKVLVLEFKLGLKNKISSLPNKKQITVSQISLAGFLNPEEIVNIVKTHDNCKQEKRTTVCQFKINNNIKLIELPVIYYPNLLKVTINNKPAAYSSVGVLDRLLVAVQPIPNQMNIIKVEFQGLKWANQISWMGWILWSLILIYQLRRSSFSSSTRGPSNG